MQMPPPSLPGRRRQQLLPGGALIKIEQSSGQAGPERVRELIYANEV